MKKKTHHIFTCICSLLQINLEPKHCYSVSVVSPCTPQSNCLYGCHWAQSSVDLWLFESVGPCVQLGPNEVLFKTALPVSFVNCCQLLKACKGTKTLLSLKPSLALPNQRYSISQIKIIPYSPPIRKPLLHSHIIIHVQVGLQSGILVFVRVRV